MANQQQPQPQEMNVVHAGGLDLPLGFHFHPSDYEITNHYLTNTVRNRDYTCTAIGEVDLNKTEPWNLPREAKMDGKEWYFFFEKDRKYLMGLRRANRATKAGYWKATEKDKEVYKPNEGEGVVLLIGMKKMLVFYEGRAPRGNKTNWVMHEYMLEGSRRMPGPASASSSAANTTATMKASASKDEWVVCRVFQKTTRIKKTIVPTYDVAVASAEIEQNQNNIPTILVPMSFQPPLLVPMPMEFPILPDFATDPVAPYFLNAGAGLAPMMPPVAGIDGASRLQINNALFGNLMAAPSQMNFYHHQMGMGVAAGQMNIGAVTGQMGIGAAVAQMDMRIADIGGFDVVALESRPPSSMVSQKDEQANAVDISSMMFVTGPGSTTTTIELDDIWKYKY